MHFRPCHAHAEVLPRLAHVDRDDVVPDDAVGIRDELSADKAWPSFEDNHLIELFTFCLMQFITMTPRSGLPAVAKCSCTNACRVIVNALR